MTLITTSIGYAYSVTVSTRITCISQISTVIS